MGRKRASAARLLIFATLAVALTACGGGGSSGSSAAPGLPDPVSMPGISSFTPDEIDPRVATKLELQGQDFQAGAMLRFLAADGSLLAESPVATVSDSGSTASVDTPVLDLRYGLVTATLELVNPDGGQAAVERALRFSLPTRSYDGSGNHPGEPAMGSAGTPLMRMLEPAYSDGISAPANPDAGSARAVSNMIFAQTESMPDPGRTSSYLWQWGQFLDHDISLTPANTDGEVLPIPVPAGDVFFDPDGSGDETINLTRSVYLAGEQPRQQLNMITAYIDASNVYGSDEERAMALRALDGSGRLKTGEGNLLPRNTEGLDNDGGADNPALFVAGDIRANEQIGLTAMHTLFLREHNRLTDEIADAHPEFDGDDIYQAARRYVGALMQVVTYREFLPLLLGSEALPPYEGFSQAVDPSIANSFSTACYRFGHSLLPGQLKRTDAAGEAHPDGHIALRDAFFNPDLLASEEDLAALLRGLALEYSQSLDARMIDDVRNFLFGPPGAVGFDLAALNIQRGRDHGLPSYVAVRGHRGLAAIDGFADIPADPDVQARLGEAYSAVEDIDLLVGALAELPAEGAMVGETILAVLSDQFQRLRDGDRYWYQNLYSGATLAELESTTLADIIRRNTLIGEELADDVFHLPEG